MKEWEEYKDWDEAIDDYIEYMKGYGKKLNRTDARKEIKKKIPHESKYQDKIIKYLKKLPKTKAWKENNGKYASTSGIPDVTAVINGIYYGFEVKRPLVGIVSDLQEQTIKELNQIGGHAYVVITVYDVEKILKEEGVI